MGITERKIREREQRRTSILNVTKGLILERGVPVLSMQDIADASELSKATLYFYFPSKESILQEILETSIGTFLAYIEERLRPGDDGLSALKKLWACYLDLFGASPDVFILTGIINFIQPYMPNGGRADSSSRLGPAEELRGLIARVLEKGVRDGTITTAVRPEATAGILMLTAMAVIDNMARMPREARDVRRVQEELKLVFELILRGVAAPGADSSLLSFSPERKP